MLYWNLKTNAKNKAGCFCCILELVFVSIFWISTLHTTKISIMRCVKISGKTKVFSQKSENIAATCENTFCTCENTCSQMAFSISTCLGLREAYNGGCKCERWPESGLSRVWPMTFTTFLGGMSSCFGLSDFHFLVHELETNYFRMCMLNLMLNNPRMFLIL